jgi:uncharacterized RDD family membrane protein YckC
VTTKPLRFDTVPAEARPFHEESAGIVTRAAASLIDLAIVALIVATLYLAVAGVWFLRQGPEFRFPIVSYAQAYVAGALVLIAYFTIGWSAGGRTYGDRLLGLRVRTVGGLELSGLRAFLRAVLCTAFPLLLAWVIVDPKNRSVQDHVLGTHVVYDWGGSRSASRSHDARGVRIYVASGVSDEADDGDAEALPGLDRER